MSKRTLLKLLRCNEPPVKNKYSIKSIRLEGKTSSRLMNQLIMNDQRTSETTLSNTLEMVFCQLHYKIITQTALNFDQHFLYISSEEQI